MGAAEAAPDPLALACGSLPPRDSRGSGQASEHRASAEPPCHAWAPFFSGAALGMGSLLFSFPFALKQG
eukprot:2015276-Prymnesium_polylepis.2